MQAPLIQLIRKSRQIQNSRTHLPSLRVEGTPKAFELLHHLPYRGLAIVGTRKPQNQSLQFLRKLFRSLPPSQLIILSGLARGIDAEAHLCALDHDIPTIAVLGGGLNFTYPRQHAALRRRILENSGLIISPFEDNSPPVPKMFASRNRYIALLSRCVWMIEAPQKSGALITAREALRASIPVFCPPAFPDDPFRQGNTTLLQGEANALWSSESLLEVWPDLKLGSKGLFPQNPVKFPHLHQLQKVILTLQSRNSFVSLIDLLEWAEAEGWGRQKLLLTLYQGLASECLETKGGGYRLGKNTTL